MPTQSNSITKTNKLPITSNQEVVLFNSAPAATSASNIVVVDNGVLIGSIQIATDSAYNGTTATMALQGSNDNVSYGAILQDDNSTAMSFTLGAASSTYTFILKAVCYKYYKVVYTKGDASAGVLTVNFIGKKVS